MLARHLALRYLRRRRSAWLAVVAVAVTVLVPVVVMGVLQGWVDVVANQVRGAESDLVVGGRGWNMPHTERLHERIAEVPGVHAISPTIDSEAMLIPMDAERNDNGARNRGIMIAGIDMAGEQALERFDGGRLHVPPVLDLSAPDLGPDQRGSGLLTPDARAWLVFATLEQSVGAVPAPLPAAPRAGRPYRPGVILGREVIYSTGGPARSPFHIGADIKLIRPDGSGGLTGAVRAEVSDTLGTGVYEIDKGTALLDLASAQQLTDMDGRHPSQRGIPRVDGWRVRVTAGSDPTAVAEAIERELGMSAGSVRTWQEVRGSMLANLQVQRTVGLVTMIFIQVLCVFIVYAVFSTLVSEKRSDIGVLLGLGASRRAIRNTFQIAGVVCCAIGGLAGWLGGWLVMAALDPTLDLIGRLIGVKLALFPQEVVFTPGTPLSFSLTWPVLFLSLSAAIGLAASALPARRASRVDPLESIRTAG